MNQNIDDKTPTLLNSTPKMPLLFLGHGRAFELAVLTPEHYLPLICALALKEKDEKVHLFNDKAVGGSLSMTSVKIG